jgi:hypothetical protein
MTESLKPVLDGVLEGQDANTIAAALTNYWTALRNLMPEAFEDPKDFVIQKSVGVFAWNQVAATVSLKCYQAGTTSRSSRWRTSSREPRASSSRSSG